MDTSAELFNALLKESIDIENVIIEEENDVCLISGENLKNNHITLSCNHKFNYGPLFNEVRQWKSNYKNKSYCINNRIHFKKQITCPYCRQTTDGLLPFYNDLNGISYQKIWYVNWPKRYWLFPDKCKYIFASGKKKGKPCDKGCCGLFCKGHLKHSHKYDNEGNLKIISKTKKTNIHDPNNTGCLHTMLRGKRKGELCGKKAKKYKKNGLDNVYYYCTNHAKKYNHPEPLIQVVSI